MSRKNVRVRAGAAPVSPDNIIWSGDFDDGDLYRWNDQLYPDYVADQRFFGCPPNGRPIDYTGTSNLSLTGKVNQIHIGTGDLLWLTDTTTHDGYKQGPILPGRLHSLGLRVRSNAAHWVDSGFVSFTKVSSTQFQVNGEDARLRFARPISGSTLGRAIRMYPGTVVAEVTAHSFAGGNTVVTVKDGSVPDGLSAVEWNDGALFQTSVDQFCSGDWDGGESTRKRTQLNAMNRIWQSSAPPSEAMVPYGTTRWASTSIFIPGDWATVTGGFMTNWQWKAQHSAGSPAIEVSETGGNWELRLRRSLTLNAPDNTLANWNSIRFSPTEVTSSPFYPDDAASIAMLGNLNRGGWTHFVMQMHMDGRTSTEGGVGFIKIWMRHGNGSWVHVLDYYPTPEWGVLYMEEGDGARWAPAHSLYCSNDQVENLPWPGRILYYDNVKIANNDGTFNSIFAQMSHDGTAPGD